MLKFSPHLVFRAGPPHFLRGLVSAAALALPACAVPTIDLVEDLPVAGPAPPVFDDRDWATVLRENVRDGSVDYDHLRAHPGPLHRFVQLISHVGPGSTPELFPTPDARLAFAINAYNACVLRAVLDEKVPPTMYPVGQRSLDFRYRFRVDRRLAKLADLRTAAWEAGGGDARVGFALCGAARGHPRLFGQPFRTDTIQRDLERLARRAMGQDHMVRIDHRQQRLLIGVAIADRRQVFLDYTAQRNGTRSPTLLSALMMLADGPRREWLNTAVGYRVGVIPFDRQLNRITPG